MLVSILIPTLFERMNDFNKKVSKLYKQIKDNKLEKKIEIIFICDNRTILLSEKRNRLQQMATGMYITHLDDDDEFSDDYCKTVIDFIESLDNLPDVIGYNQLALVGQSKFVVKCDLNCPLRLVKNNYGDITNEKYNCPQYYRYPWQWCLWKRERFQKVWRTDIDSNAREDINWLNRIVLEKPASYRNIDKILHTYHFEQPKNSTCQ